MEKLLQITAGRGPAECTWVAAQVLKKVIEEAAEFGVQATVLQREVGLANGTVASAIVHIIGKEANVFVASWVGTIQWIGKSTFRKLHKRSNWFIGIFDVEIGNLEAFSEKDIRYQAMRSSGAGGQHVNKVSSAVRATHIPTGISVVCMDSRSQHQNKKLATARLLEKLNEAQINLWRQQLQSQWTNQLAIERGNPIRTFEGSDFKKQKEEKKFKKERQRLKNELRNEND